jgi:hypothetical protein
MSHLFSFLSITAGHLALEFPRLYETEDEIGGKERAE